MYKYAAYALIFLLTMLTAFSGGLKVGSDHQLAKQVTVLAAIAATEKRTQTVIAESLARMTPIQQVIRQKTETLIREVPVYRDCINDDRVERLLDAARANVEPTEPPSDRVLP